MALVRFALGEAHIPHRTMMAQQDCYLDTRGWSHLLSFYAYTSPHPGTACFAVGEAHSPHRIMIAQQDGNLDTRGWSHLLFFYAYDAPHPGTVRFSVGQAYEPHRVIVAQRTEDACTSGWAHKLSFYAFPFPPFNSAIPAALWPLFVSHCLTCSPSDSSPGNGLSFSEGGELEDSRQNSFYLLKVALLEEMLPAFLKILATLASPVEGSYYVTGTQAINCALSQRGLRTIPTDDIDIKFCTGANLQPLTAAWLAVATHALHARSSDLAALGLAVDSVVVLPLHVVNWAGLRVTLRDVTPSSSARPFHWDVVQVGDFDFDHWDVVAHTVVVAGVRYLTEAAAVGDLAVVWPRTAASKTRRRLLKGDYWRWVTGNATLPDCVGVKPPPATFE